MPNSYIAERRRHGGFESSWDAIRWEYFVLVLIDKLFFGDLAEPLSYHG